jgi:hypothetical protein
MRVFVKVGRHGITIPIEKLKGIKEGDIVQIQIEKLYMNNKVKKDLRNIYLHA